MHRAYHHAWSLPRPPDPYQCVPIPPQERPGPLGQAARRARVPPLPLGGARPPVPEPVGAAREGGCQGAGGAGAAAAAAAGGGEGHRGDDAADRGEGGRPHGGGARPSHSSSSLGSAGGCSQRWADCWCRVASSRRFLPTWISQTRNAECPTPLSCAGPRGHTSVVAEAWYHPLAPSQLRKTETRLAQALGAGLWDLADLVVENSQSGVPTLFVLVPQEQEGRDRRESVLAGTMPRPLPFRPRTRPKDRRASSRPLSAYAGGTQHCQASTYFSCLCRSWVVAAAEAMVVCFRGLLRVWKQDTAKKAVRAPVNKPSPQRARSVVRGSHLRGPRGVLTSAR